MVGIIYIYLSKHTDKMKTIDKKAITTITPFGLELVTIEGTTFNGFYSSVRTPDNVIYSTTALKMYCGEMSKAHEIALNEFLDLAKTRDLSKPIRRI